MTNHGIFKQIKSQQLKKGGCWDCSQGQNVQCLGVKEVYIFQCHRQQPKKSFSIQVQIQENINLISKR